MKVQFKIKTWEVITIPDDKLKDVIANIQSGKIKDSQDIYENLTKNEQISYFDRQFDREYNFDCDEQLTPDENEGYSTIEVYDEDGELVYWNGVSPLNNTKYEE